MVGGQAPLDHSIPASEILNIKQGGEGTFAAFLTQRRDAEKRLGELVTSDTATAVCLSKQQPSLKASFCSPSCQTSLQLQAGKNISSGRALTTRLNQGVIFFSSCAYSK